MGLRKARTPTFLAFARVLNILGKGGKERIVPLHLEAVERVVAWLATAAIADDRPGPLFRAAKSLRGAGRDGFRREPLTTPHIASLSHTRERPHYHGPRLATESHECRARAGRSGFICRAAVDKSLGAANLERE